MRSVILAVVSAMVTSRLFESVISKARKNRSIHGWLARTRERSHTRSAPFCQFGASSKKNVKSSSLGEPEFTWIESRTLVALSSSKSFWRLESLRNKAIVKHTTYYARCRFPNRLWWLRPTLIYWKRLLSNRRWSRRANRPVRSCHRGARLSAGR